MTCKDCISYDVCVIVEHSSEEYDHYTEYGCEDFKNKADYVEVVRCKAELEIMRNYIHDNNLEYDLLSYSKRNGG